MVYKLLISSTLRPFHVELLALSFLPPATPESGRPSGGSIFAAPAPRGAPPPACGFSAPGHSCSGALRHRPAGSPLRNCRARKVSAPGRTSRPRLRLFLRSALLRSAPSGRRLRRPLRARAPPLRPLRPQAPQPLGAFPRHPRRPSATLRAGAPFFEAALGGLPYIYTFFLLFLVGLLIFAAFLIFNLTYANENRKNFDYFWFGHHNFRSLEKFFNCVKKILFRGFERPRRKLLIIHIYILRLWEH